MAGTLPSIADTVSLLDEETVETGETPYAVRYDEEGPKYLLFSDMLEILLEFVTTETETVFAILKQTCLVSRHLRNRGYFRPPAKPTLPTRHRTHDR